MSKFTSRPTNVHAPISTTGETTSTFEGGVGHVRDAKSELFLLAAANMVSEDTFYESGRARDDRFEKLIHDVTRSDPEWMQRFAPYLRDTMNMRSASIVAAAEYVKAGGPHGRAVVSAACLRGDEPAEMLAYWHSRYGRRIPKPVKRGVGDAAVRLFNERASLRYDGNDRPWRMADVIELTHPKPKSAWQSKLFRLLLDKRHHGDMRALAAIRDDVQPIIGPRTYASNDPVLAVIEADVRLRALPEADRRAALASEDWEAAGWSWERTSGWLPGGMDAEAWTALIPKMGYMALIRNLRNFDQVGISDAVALEIAARLTNPDEVAKSRQFPIRFLKAYEAVNSLRWSYPLERALQLSLNGVPSLQGRTLIMCDVSGSMTHESYLGTFHRGWRKRNPDTLPWQHAAVFGTALALRAEHADLFAYGDVATMIDVPRDGAVLKIMDSFEKTPAFQTGTQTLGLAAEIVRRQPHRYDRVVILTDEQAFAPNAIARRPLWGWRSDPHQVQSSFDAATSTLDTVPRIYTFNFAGYAPGHLPSGERGRYTFGGLNDSAFALVNMIEETRDTAWPF